MSERQSHSRSKGGIEMKNLLDKGQDVLDDAARVEIRSLKHAFFQPIFFMLFVFTSVGVPFNFCFDDSQEYLSRNRIPTIIFGIKVFTSRTFKIYTIILSAFHHFVLLLSLYFLGQQLLVKPVFDEDTAFYFLIFFGILAGVIAIDMVWLNQTTLGNFLDEMFDYWKLLEERPRYRKLFTENVSELNRYQLRFTLIGIFSGALFLSLIFLIVFLGIISCFDKPPEVPGLFWNMKHLLKSNINDTDSYHFNFQSRLIGLVSYFSIFFFLSKAFVLLVFVWVIEFEIDHLNLFIKNLSTNLCEPDLGAIEIIKKWYRNLLNKVHSMDRFSSFYIAVYLGLLFYGLIFFIEKALGLFNLHEDIKTVIFCSYVLGIFICFVFLMYGLREFGNVHHKSSKTRSILYDFVLNTNAEQRSSQYFAEIDFVCQGLLSRPAVFTILGKIPLTHGFMVHLCLLIYTYGIIFHKLIHPPGLKW